MRERDLRIDQEPARHWWYVYDNEDEGRMLYGPYPDRSAAQGFVDGYEAALIDLDEYGDDDEE